MVPATGDVNTPPVATTSTRLPRPPAPVKVSPTSGDGAAGQLTLDFGPGTIASVESGTVSSQPLSTETSTAVDTSLTPLASAIRPPVVTVPTGRPRPPPKVTPTIDTANPPSQLTLDFGPGSSTEGTPGSDSAVVIGPPSGPTTTAAGEAAPAHSDSPDFGPSDPVVEVTPVPDATFTYIGPVLAEPETNTRVVSTPAGGPPKPPKPPATPTTYGSQVATLDFGQTAPSEDSLAPGPTLTYIGPVLAPSETSSRVASTPVGGPPKPVPFGGGTTTSTSQGLTLDFGNTASAEETPPSFSYIGPVNAEPDSTTLVFTPPAGGPPRPPGSISKTTAAAANTISSDVPVAAPSVTLDVTSSVEVNNPGLQLTASGGSPAYNYPPGLGGGDELTEIFSAPTRTNKPTRTSIVPNKTTRIGPPPADTWTPPSEDTDAATTAVRNGPPPADTGFADDTLSYLPITRTVNGTLVTSIQTTLRSAVESITSTNIDSSFTLDFGIPTISDPPLPVTRPPLNYTAPTTYANGSGWGNVTTGFDPYLPTASPSTWSFTVGTSYTTDTRGSSISYCDPKDANKPTTTYSIVYTSTITWFGNPSDYTAPYAPISTPTESCTIPKTPVRLTLSYCTATGSSTKYVTCDATTSTLMYTLPDFAPGPTTAPTITFVTTDKNPTVVFSSIETPDYGVSQPAITKDLQHTSATPKVDTPPDYISYQTPQRSQEPGHGGPAKTSKNPGPASVVLGPSSTADPVPVTIRPTAIIISSTTITDRANTPTQTVVVGGETWTVNPSEVVGGGQTATRPTLTTGGVYVPVPKSTTVGGVAVTVSSSVAVIGGTSLTLGLTPITTNIGGQPITAGPAGVVVGTATIPVVADPPPTQVVVEGGGLITAIGPSVVVIHSTTITYGPGVTLGGPGGGVVSSTVVDGELVTIGPSGVEVHGITLGGATAKDSSTQYEIVGGATITQIGPSVVVVGGQTYTVGPGTGSTTTVVGGNTVTIPPHNDAITTVIGGSTVTLPPSSNPSTTVVGGNTIVLPPHSDPITTVVGGATIILPPSSDPTTTVVGGSTVTIPPHADPITTVIGGQTVTLPPSDATATTVIAGQTITIPPHETPITTVIAGQTITLPPSPFTQTTIIGGQTLTIPPHSAPLTTVIAGQTITLPPSNTVSTTVLNGQTITIPPHSTALTTVLGGQTITLPPSSAPQTTVLDGETITIGPGGLTITGHTIGYPFGPTTTVTLTPTAAGATPTNDMGIAAEPTASEDAAAAGRGLRGEKMGWGWWGVVGFGLLGVVV